MPVIDEQSRACSLELVAKANKFVDSTITTSVRPAFIDEHARIRPAVAYAHMCDILKPMNDQARSILKAWINVLRDHYGPLTYGRISPVARAWLWAVHGNELHRALALGLILERVVFERHKNLPHGTDSGPPISEVEQSAALFASDAQCYSVEHRDALAAWYSQWWNNFRTHAEPMMTMYFSTLK